MIELIGKLMVYVIAVALLTVPRWIYINKVAKENSEQELENHSY